MKLRGWLAAGVAVCAVSVSGLEMVSGSVAQGSQGSGSSAPVNDNYLNSLGFNHRGTALNRTKTLETFADTTSATLQGNIFNPCGQSSCPAGPAEVTSCNGTHYGKTVWYDFYPDANGAVRIRTSGFDNVITLYRFDDNPKSSSYLLPDVAHRVCTHQSAFPSEELDANVKKGLAYTIQVGGAASSSQPSGASGKLQLLFDYLVTPRRLTADAFLKARATSDGLQLIDLVVSTARSAHVRVTCDGHCRPQSKFGHAREDFSALNGVRMPAGASLRIDVTARGAIGTVIVYRIVKGNFTKRTFCTEPNSRKLRNKCQ